MKYVGLLLFAALFAGCQTYSDDELSEFDKEITSYIEENNLELTKSPSGMYYRIDEKGEGDLIRFTDVVSFKYKGQLLDGTVFDEQLEEPVEYGVDQLIGAWKEIMLSLRRGGKAYLIAPPSLGYGTHDLEDIPPSSILIFEMEVVDVK